MKHIDFKENIVKKNKIPVLIYTPEWIQLFNNYRSKSVEKAVADLEALLSQEKVFEEELREAERRKKIIMNKILYISREINENNDKSALQKLDEAQRELLSLNEKIPQLMEELESIPGKINEQNTVLLKETIIRAYELIKENKEESEKCQKDVNEIRLKLTGLIQKKVDVEERVNKLYSFIHGMVGAEEMESLDKSFLEKK